MDETKLRGLARQFAFGCAAIMLGAGVCLYYGIREYAASDLLQMSERNSAEITRTYVNALWPTYARFIGNTAAMDAEAIRAHPMTAALRADTLAHLRGLPVVKVKIYDLGGRTAFSTDPGQIGRDKQENDGFRSARAGRVVSELYHRDRFSAFEQEISDRDLLSSYVPIAGTNGRIEGVAEVYYDLTPHLAKMRDTARYEFLVIAGVLVLLYAALLIFAFLCNRVIIRQHRENLALAAEGAAAAEESRMKSEFLANMSHELRTPLNAILGFSDSMRQELFGALGSARYRTYADDIWASGRLLQGIVDDVLDMAKIENGSLELSDDEFELRELLDDAVRMMAPAAQKKSISLRSDCPPGPVWLRCDRRRLGQALLNILSNAVKFSPEHGEIAVGAAFTALGGLAISVADRGIGIAEEDIPLVLKPFGQVSGSYSRNHGGTGLGLPIAKSFLELHDGSMAIDSAVGQGTTVTLELPAARLYAGQTARNGGNIAA